MIKQFIILCITLILLISCYTQKIILNADKNSGQIYIEYSLTDDTLQLLSIALNNFNESSENKFDPIVLTDQELFKESFNNTEEYKLKSVEINTTNGYKGKIVIIFNNLDKILNDIPKGLVNINIVKDKDNLTISQILNYKEMDPEGTFKKFILQQKEDDINFYNQLTKDTSFKFILNTTQPIRKVEGVTLSNDKKVAVYTFKLNDFIVNDDKILKFIITL